MRASAHLPLIRALDFVPVISGGHNDDPDWLQWSDSDKHKTNIAAFKLPLAVASGDDPGQVSPVAFLIVKSMLLTGFDAPVEQVLYLDRSIKEAELLQAIARVNRTASGKNVGYVVDYYGVGEHLKQALAAYSSEDLEGLLQSIADELPKLADRRQRVRNIFLERGVDRFDTEDDVEACVTLLEDERLRVAFEVALKQFLTTLDIVMPRPESLPFQRDAKFYGMVQVRARRRYREGDTFDVSLYGEKVRSLIDDHVLALGVDQKIPPVSITAPDFRSKVSGLRTDRAKASEMEHAVRYHIRKHFDEDPAHYSKLSEKLDRILEALKEQWDQLALALSGLVDEALKGRQVDATGLDPKTEAPFYGLLGQELEAEATADRELTRHDAPPAELSPPQAAVLRQATTELVAHLQGEIAVVGFWQNTYAQDVLRKWVVQHLDGQQVDGQDLFKLDRLSEVADRVVELARANHSKLVGERMSSPSHTLPSRLAVAGLDFEVRLSGVRRSIGITVDRDGALILNAPHGCDEAELASFAHEKRMWVYKKLAEKDLLLSHRPVKEFVSGEGFAYLGSLASSAACRSSRRGGEARTRPPGDAARPRSWRVRVAADDRLVSQPGYALATPTDRAVGASDGGAPSRGRRARPRLPMGLARYERSRQPSLGDDAAPT